MIQFSCIMENVYARSQSIIFDHNVPQRPHYFLIDTFSNSEQVLDLIDNIFEM